MKIRLILMSLLVATIFELTTTRAQAHPASGIVVDRSGNIYFSDLETVWKLDTRGQLTVFRSGMRGRHVHELSIDEQENIYGADVSYNSSTKGWISDVWKMTPNGAFGYLLEPTERPPRGWSIWRDRSGNMYLVDQNNHTKRETLLLRRTPDGSVMTFAGGEYGHADGKGTQAKFSSVGGMTFGPDGSIYLTDGAFLRKVTMDGAVMTLAKDLTATTSEDQSRLFAGSYGSLAGLTVDAGGNIYVADAGNRRLLRINNQGSVEVLLRSEPPYFPTGVAAAGGNLYILEVGFTLPNASSGPRIRKIDSEGRTTTLTTVGGEGNPRSRIATQAGVAAESTLAFFYNDGRIKYTLVLLILGALSMVAIMRRQRRRARE
jgi:DNA-binding beta-propeller fold protein YncE